MCGILGIASKIAIVDRDWLSVGRDTMVHRGPDDAGEWWSEDNRVGFAHRRLSIIDLSPAGRQPMHDGTNTFTIVFNGEIYNFLELREELAAKGFVFRSHSDTEVILAAYREWGTYCLSRFNGIFALAIYDRLQQSLFLARDRAGEKPLFYRHDGNSLRFASELKAILADKTVSSRIDEQALDCYLAMGFVPGDMCIISGFNKLPPAHAMKFNVKTGEIRIWRYWQLPEFDDSLSFAPIDETALLNELEVLLEDSVRRQLVADVPVGILLSGGVDSSLVTAMAARTSSRIQTYTIGFPGHGKLDETEHARLIARHFGTTHSELIAEPATADLLPYLARQFDEPVVDSSMIPTYLVSQLVREHCTVALGGDGGDELFGGYGHYSRLLWMQERVRGIPLSLRRVLAYTAEKTMPVGMKGRNWIQGLGVDLKKDVPLIASYFDATTRKKLMSIRSDWRISAENVLKMRVPFNDDMLQRATRMDFQNYMAEDILVKVDRASMSNSLEVRAPLLDYRLIEFAYGKVPSILKANSNDKKILLKHLTSRMLPPEFDRRRKQGFSIPLAEWLKGGAFRDLFYDVLTDSQSIFDLKVVNGLLQGSRSGRNNSERLFALVFFELWRREFKVML